MSSQENIFHAIDLINKISLFSGLTDVPIILVLLASVGA
jgi:hypothetical protein